MSADVADHAEARLLEATVLQWTWKTPAMRAMTLAVCRLALERGSDPFSANDLPDMDHGGSGIAGAVFHRLLREGLLAKVGHFLGGAFYPLRVSNPGGNPVGVYRLNNGALVRALLRAHGGAVEEFRQVELGL